MEALRSTIVEMLGLDSGPGDLEFTQMACRTLVVFIWVLGLIHLSHRRLLGRASGSDTLMLVVLGSVLSRAINGQSSFFPTLGVSALTVMLHRVLMSAAFHVHWISLLAKGRDHVLVRNGQMDRDALSRTKFTEDDLMENLRLHGIDALTAVKEARLERSGTISVVKRTDG